MKVCYIISTCDKYLDTRVKYQMETMFKNIDINDIYYLTSKPNVSKRQFGWLSPDDTQNITWKYIHFIYNMDIHNYDWYIFIDDDTFVYHNRLIQMLNKYNSAENYYIGKELDHIKNQFCLYMSGGAGYAISKSLYSLIREYIKNIGKNEAYYPLINLENQFCDDLCIGLWIQDIAKHNNIKQINNDLFHIDLNANVNTAITIHKVITEEQFQYYNSISTELNNVIEVTLKKDTVFVLVTDKEFLNKTKKTIIDLRSRGKWIHDITVITIGFNLNSNFKDFYNINEIQFDKIDTTSLLNKIGPNGFNDTTDKREIQKLTQWEKLHVFDDYFKSWQRVIYLDAGLRVLDDVQNLLNLDYKGKLLAPIDGKIYEANTFKCQLSHDKPDLIEDLKNELGNEILNSNYMLNCMWIYDTDILDICNKNQLIDAMNKYTFCKTNEMGIMNILYHFKYKLWTPFPVRAMNGKILFDWCELNQKYPTTWRDYCFIKYSVSISFEDT